MTPEHDPETTALSVETLTSPEHPLATPLEKLGEACERLQTWSSDLASGLAKGERQGPRAAKADKLVGEKLLGDVLEAAAPVIGHLARLGGQ